MRKGFISVRLEELLKYQTRVKSNLKAYSVTIIQFNFLYDSSLDFTSSLSPSSPSYPLPLFLLRKSENLFSVIMSFKLHKEDTLTPGI